MRALGAAFAGMLIAAAPAASDTSRPALRWSRVDLDGARALSPAAVRHALEPPIAPDSLTARLAAVAALYADQGFLEPRFTPSFTDSVLHVRIDEGPQARIAAVY